MTQTYTQQKPWIEGRFEENLMVTTVEQGGFGGSVAAPIARRVFDALRGDPDPAPVQTYRPNVD